MINLRIPVRGPRGTPGTPGGLLEFLASDCAAAKELLRRYVFFVVPVLNPDGREGEEGPRARDKT